LCYCVSKCDGYNLVGLFYAEQGGDPYSVNLTTESSDEDEEGRHQYTDGSHTCALYKSGRIDCWGDNTYGQLGKWPDDPNTSINPTRQPSDELHHVMGLVGKVDSLAVGKNHTCAITSVNFGEVNTLLWCWGKNDFGQLGITEINRSFTSAGLEQDARLDPTTPTYYYRTISHVPVYNFLNYSTLRQVVAGDNHTCIREGKGPDQTGERPYGRIACWGANDYGQLGDGTTILRGSIFDTTNARQYVKDPPTNPNAQVLLGAVNIWADENYTCAEVDKGDGTPNEIICWGEPTFLTVEKTAAIGRIIHPSQVVVYTYTIRNAGPKVTGIEVTDDHIPNAEDIHCPKDFLENNEEMVCAASYTVTRADILDHYVPGEGGHLINTVTVTSDNAETVTDTLDIPVFIKWPELPREESGYFITGPYDFTISKPEGWGLLNGYQVIGFLQPEASFVGIFYNYTWNRIFSANPTLLNDYFYPSLIKNDGSASYSTNYPTWNCSLGLLGDIDEACIVASNLLGGKAYSGPQHSPHYAYPGWPGMIVFSAFGVQANVCPGNICEAAEGGFSVYYLWKEEEGSFPSKWPLTIEVHFPDQQSARGVNVCILSGSTVIQCAQADYIGQAAFSLPPGEYRISFEKNGHTVWSGEEDHIAVPYDAFYSITVPVFPDPDPALTTVTVTVTDAYENPKPNLTVWAYDGSTYANIFGATNAQGEATLYLPAGTYRFKVYTDGASYWSGSANHCTIPGCESASIATGVPVLVTVQDVGGQAQGGVNVWAFNGAEYSGYGGPTDTEGHVTMYLPAGGYRFRVDRPGQQYWSGETNHCTVPACTQVGITVGKAVVVTVKDANNNPKPNLTVWAYNGSNYVNILGTTNTQGEATLYLPVGNYRFKTYTGGASYWSGAANHCEIPYCSSAGITANNPVAVAVADAFGNPEAGLNVRAYVGNTWAGQTVATNAQGQALFGLPAGDYRFAVEKAGVFYWSGITNHCTVPACSAVQIVRRDPVTLAVLDSAGNPEAGLLVRAYVGNTYAWVTITTNVQGQAVFGLPAGDYRFVVEKAGVFYWSGIANHCTVPACTAVQIIRRDPVTLTVLDSAGNPKAGLLVRAYVGSMYAWVTLTTNAQGQALFGLPSGEYRFSVEQTGQIYWSGETNHCTVPGCSSASITISSPAPTPTPVALHLKSWDRYMEGISSRFPQLPGSRLV
jgi:hypothetical protein